MAPLTDDDRVLIQILRPDEGFNSFQMIKEFPNRKWNRNTLKRIKSLIRKIDETGTSRRKPRESVRTARTTANIGSPIVPILIR